MTTPITITTPIMMRVERAFSKKQAALPKTPSHAGVGVGWKVELFICANKASTSSLNCVKFLKGLSVTTLVKFICPIKAAYWDILFIESLRLAFTESREFIVLLKSVAI